MTHPTPTIPAATASVARPQPMCTNAKAEKAAPVTSSTTTHDPGAHAKLPPVPDLDNRRFCRACQAVLPVEAFPLGKRRYLCRRHMWLRVKKPSKERARADPHRKLLSVLWKRCWNDAKTTFGHARIALLQRDIAKVLSGFDSGKGVHSKPPTIKSKTGAAEPAIALLPVNPSQLLSQENHVVVEIDARRDMLRAYREGGMEQYVEELGRLD